MEQNEQLSLNLTPTEPYSLKYFVPHQGVAEGVAVLEQAVKEFQSGASRFVMVYLYGPAGAGKTHLLNGYAKLALTDEVASERVVVRDLNDYNESDEWVREFISTFERLKADGGLLLISAANSPDDATSNPHVLSRLLSGSVVSVDYPPEEELEPLILSLLERRNLRLGARSINYLLKRIPRDPLSFDVIFGKISELSFSTQKPAKLGVVREVVAGGMGCNPKSEHSGRFSCDTKEK